MRELSICREPVNLSTAASPTILPAKLSVNRYRQQPRRNLQRPRQAAHQIRRRQVFAITQQEVPIRDTRVGKASGKDVDQIAQVQEAAPIVDRAQRQRHTMRDGRSRLRKFARTSGP